MWYVALAVILIIFWIFSKISDGISDVSSKNKARRDFEDERNNKYGNREIDLSKSLLERNTDIINDYANKIRNDYYRHYYLENETRDCINEICLAEHRADIRPGHKYLSDWQTSAPADWVELSNEIKNIFSDRQRKLGEIETKISKTESELNLVKNKHRNPLDLQKLEKRDAKESFCIEEIKNILTPNKISWSEREKAAMNFNGNYDKFPKFTSEIKSRNVRELNEKIEDYNNLLETDIEGHQRNKAYFEKIFSGYKESKKDFVVQRLNYIVGNIKFAKSVPQFWDIDFDEEQAIAIVEIQLPDVVHNQIFKKVELKTGIKIKPLNQKETREQVPNIHPAIILRIAYEIFRNDTHNVIKLLVINGWVEFDDPKTGTKTKAYTASLAVEKDKIKDLNLPKLNPLYAFQDLNGKSAGSLIDIVPIKPALSLNKKDSRFIDAKNVLSDLSTKTNLASMDWQDFEYLIRELFEKEFADRGAEVKITQASRDRGVDAVVFDPDPIHGGKYVIQAKRYTNTVDVSAVRDLCAVVAKEGASRGILVTTSTYGADAYAFATGAPVTLLNGAELLGLLEKHGYKFRINLAEARKTNLNILKEKRV